MAYEIYDKSIIRNEFFNPIFSFFPNAKHTRECHAFGDLTWIEAGIRRCLGSYQSGREFIQELADDHSTTIMRSTFFTSYNSKRRLKMLDEISHHITSVMRQSQPDALAHHVTLADYDIYAGDGHFIAAAVHDPVDTKRTSQTKPNDNTRQNTVKHPTGHLYTLNLRNHALTHLCVADQIERKKEHDMRALKRQDAQQLRQGAATGIRVKLS